MIRRVLPFGYTYWHVQRNRNGWRQIGPEAFCIVDDFGNLVFAGENEALEAA